MGHPLQLGEPTRALKVITSSLLLLQDIIFCLVRMVIDMNFAKLMLKEEPTLFYICLASWAGILIFVLNIFKGFKSFDDGRMDDTTEKYLSSQWSKDASPCYDSAAAPKDAEAMINALESQAFTEDAGECAKQMQNILKAGHIPYSSLIDAPENLLRVSPGHEGLNGGLWTRFTVQYNLFAGSIVALGGEEQHKILIKSQKSGRLGCFSFTECGTGVLSGAGVETTAVFDPETESFIINSPNSTSKKNWISQGMYAEEAVILAELIIDGEKKGPHLFWTPIADSAGGDRRSAKNSILARPEPRDGVNVGSNPEKTCMHGLDNATMTFENFSVPVTGLLNKFCEVVQENGKWIYRTKLPSSAKRMLDILIFRLLTGRIVLSEATMSHSISRLRRSYQYCQQRELWRGRKEKGEMMADKPLIKAFFRDYGRTSYIIAAFIAHHREDVGKSIREDSFKFDTIEATCMAKFIGTGFGLDLVDATRKVMSARGLQEDSWLGANSFLPLATCAAEGDNTIMELKVVQDLVRGRTSKFPLGLMWRISSTSQGWIASKTYMKLLAKAMYLGVKALNAGQLLRDIAWARAHMRIIDNWMNYAKNDSEKLSWLNSYESVLMRFPTPYQH
jgi:acyl-CoA oxidase